MRILPFYVIPIFLGQTNCRPIGAQVRFFDVFYRMPPVVGFDVIGCEPPTTPVTGFVVLDDQPAPPVIGLDVRCEPKTEGVIGFAAEQPCDDGPIIGFEVVTDERKEGITGFDVSEEDDTGGVVGFSVEEEET